MKIKNIICFMASLMLAVLSLNANSLFSAADPVTASLFTDRRARSVGDIITIVISESYTSAQSGKTGLTNKSTMLAELKSLLYPTASTPLATTDALYRNTEYLGSRALTARGTMPKSDWGSEKEFEGDGEMSSSSKLSGSLSAMIIDVLPNGNFLIEGKQELSIDKEEKTIIVSGIVRPEDIGADNTILSRYVANAKISFSGKGPITSFRERSFLQKCWDFLGLY
ncbi:MAG: hypothetical protein ACD_79C00962G0004 [uncultured bacterium]|nr:MAG: hypothetical protein ACD_79C00962G0004 [uncultured bacterium]